MKKLHWTGVFIELAIVVVGVFSGLQVSSGHLGLLPAGAAESGLSQYYAFDTAQDVYRSGLNSGYRETVRQIIPITTQIAMRAGCSDVRDNRGNIVGFAKNCELQVDPAALKETAMALRGNPAILADLQYQYSFAVSATLNLGGVEKNIDAALTALGAAEKSKR